MVLVVYFHRESIGEICHGYVPRVLIQDVVVVYVGLSEGGDGLLPGGHVGDDAVSGRDADVVL